MNPLVKHAKVEGIKPAKVSTHDDNAAVADHHPHPSSSSSSSSHAAPSYNSASTTVPAVAAVTVVGQQQQQQQQQLSAHTLLQHPSDIQIKPIVGNKNIETTLEKFAFKESSLPFVAYNALDSSSISKHTQSELEAHLTIVYKALQKTYTTQQVATTNSSQQTHLQANATNQSLLQERIRIMSYLFSIAATTEVGW